ncbi:hypothetical protein DSECCO2_407880 [anaerobic digester metagenome]
MGTGRLDLFQAEIFADPFVQELEVAVETARGHCRLEVVDEGRVDAALRNGPLSRVIGVVEVEERHGPYHRIGKVPVRRSNPLAREELEASVGPDVDDQVGPEHPVEVPVGGEEVVRGWQGRVVEDPTGRSIAPRTGTTALRLGADDCVAQPEARNHHPAAVEHRDRQIALRNSRRFAPCLVHPVLGLGGEVLEPPGILGGVKLRKSPARPDDLLDRGPAELRVRPSIGDLPDERLAVLGHLDLVSCLPEVGEDKGNALQRVQVGGGPDGRLEPGARAVVQHECHPLLGRRSPCQGEPTFDAGDESGHPFDDRDLPAAVPQRADGEHLDHPLELRHDHSPTDLSGAHAVHRRKPGFLRPVIEDDRMEDRDPEAAEEGHRFVGLRAEGDGLQIDDPVDPTGEELLDHPSAVLRPGR